MTPASRFAAFALVALLIPSCASSQRTLRYDPVPAHVQVEIDAAAAPVASVYATIAEARREGPDWAIRARVRIDNRRAGPLSIVSDEVRLLDGDLLELGAPLATPALPSGLPPGGTWAGVLDFPLPPGLGPGDVNLDGLHLHIAVASDTTGAVVPVALAFAERPRAPRSQFVPPYPYGFYGHRFFAAPYGFYSYRPGLYWSYY